MDVEEWQAIARRYSHVYRWAWDRDDLYGQALLICCQHAEVTDRGLLVTIVSRRLIDYVRQQRGRIGDDHELRPLPRSLDEVDDEGHRVIPEPSVPDFTDTLIDAIGAAQRLEKLLRPCTGPEREALYASGAPGGQRALAERAGVTEGAISHRIRLGLARL